MTTTIKLGDVAKDSVTGFQGVATGYSTHLNNCPRWTLQPQEVKDGKAIESRTFDAPLVEFVGPSGIPVIPVTRSADPPELGDTVRDVITGLEGVVLSTYIFSAGCVRTSVQPRALKDGLPVDPSWFDECHLLVVTRANPKPKPAKTGGPRPEPVR